MSDSMKTNDKRILCPFFKAAGPRELRCESPIENVNIRLIFPSLKDYDLQRCVFCENMYKRCEIYRSVMYNRYNEVE